MGGGGLICLCASSCSLTLIMFTKFNLEKYNYLKFELSILLENVNMLQTFLQLCKLVIIMIVPLFPCLCVFLCALVILHLLLLTWV